MQEWLNVMANEAKSCGLSLTDFVSVLETKFDLDSMLYINEISRAWE